MLGWLFRSSLASNQSCLFLTVVQIEPAQGSELHTHFLVADRYDCSHRHARCIVGVFDLLYLVCWPGFNTAGSKLESALQLLDCSDQLAAAGSL